jgi:two-component system cell cycle sensor histidine kinase/response regulator CckA
MSDQPGGQDPNPAAPDTAEISEGALLRQAGVVHDVNQMLAVILGRSELLLFRESGGPRREGLEAIALAASDAAAMLKRLQRGLSVRPGQGPQAEVCLAEVVRDVSLLIRPAGTGQWASSENDSTEPSWVLDTAVPESIFTSVPGQVIREVLSNLVINALEVLPAGGQIRIEAEVQGDRLDLTVVDNGPGLDNETARRIFEPGFSTSGDGLRGIGLAGSRQLLKCFDGRLNLGQSQGSGAAFVVDLPRIEPVLENTIAGPLAKSAGTSANSPVAVLVVDDEPAVREMLADVLTELDCRVTAVGDAKAALEIFEPDVFGMAVVDQTLPGQSGLELAAQLREQDRCLAVVLVTGWGQENILASADPAIVDLTATKPLEWTRIIDILSQGETLNRERRSAAGR